MERILFIMGNMGLGGAETHIMKVYRKIDRKKYQFDFILNVANKCYYEDEIVELGGRIFRVTPKSKSVIQNYTDIKKIVQDKQYKIVFKCGEQAMSWTEMLAAKQGGAIKRIMRSTNSKGGASKLSYLVHCISRIPLNILVTDKIAPSREAGIWLFGKENVNSVTLMNNGLNLAEYEYIENYRLKYRQEFNIPETAYVVGHVGRFSQQKNHVFLLKVFKEIQKKREDSYLVLVGDGELLEDVKSAVKKMQLEDKVIFAGNRKDVNRIYSAFDVFVFPSLYEGLPNTLIEAQANGLRCFASDTITREANITDNTVYIPLNDPSEWGTIICSTPYKRKNPRKPFQEKCYTIESVVEKYEEIFAR